MKAEGIDMSHVRLVDGEKSPFSFVMVDSLTGRRSIAFYPGCAFVTPADCIDRAAIQSAKLLHVDMATEAVFAACEAAKQANIPISVDANALFPGLDELLHLSNIFITAREITCGLSGKEDPVESGKHLLKEYNLDLVVVTLGPEGSAAVTQNGTASSPGFPVEVIDTTGAGDVFHGAYLYGHLSGWPIERTLRFANAAGAIMCTTQIGWAGIPTREQVEKFLEEKN
jgi:ribokinase